MRIAYGLPRGGLSALLGALALGPALAAAAATPELRFRADFDRGTAAPSIAAPGTASCLTRGLDAGPGVGARGGALLLRAGERCEFSAAGHASPSAGTLSFWAKPHDWSDGEGRHQGFFEWFSRDGDAAFVLYVDSPAQAETVRLVVEIGRSGDPHRPSFQIYAPATWSAGVWQKIDVTWDEREMVIYANGVAGERLPLETVRIPAPAATGGFRLTPPTQRGDATVVDEVELWDGALPADRIAKRFRAASAPLLAPARLRAPRAPVAPRVDGSLDDEAWPRAARIPLLPDAETGFAGLLVPHAALAWSSGALHLGLEAPLTDAGDAFDVVLAPAAGGPSRSFRVTTRGLAGEDAALAGRVEVAARSGADAWSAEVSVPFAALGVEASAEAELRLDLRHRPAAPGALGVGGRLADAALTLGDELEGVRIAAGPELALGRIALDFERAAGAEAELELARAGGRPWRERIGVRGRREVREAPEPAEGVLRIAARDDAGRELARIESRLAKLDAPGLLPIPEPEARGLGVEVDLGWLDGRWLRALAAGRASAQLSDRGPKGVEGPIRLALEGSRARASLASGLARGRHVLALELRSAFGSLALEREVEVPELPWLGNTIGESDEVLEPWLPLAWEDDSSVRVWGRRYRFAGPLLAQVEGRGGPLLRAPMELRLTTQAGASALRSTASEIVRKDAARAELRGHGSFDGAALDVAWESWIEYDGLVLTTLTLMPRSSGVRVDGLELEIPLESRIAKHLRGTRRGSTMGYGREAWDGRRFEGSFEPMLWLSDEREGFLWFSESAADWVGAERRGAVEVRGGPDAGMTLRLIGESVVLPGPLRYAFGFQATPVKPVLGDARAWNFGIAGAHTPHERAIAWYDGYALADGLWELARPQAVAARDRELGARGVRPLYYATTSATPDHLPAFRLFAPLWRSAWSSSYWGGPHPETGLRGPSPAYHLAGVCPADASFQARMLHDANALLRATDALGLYTDTDGVVADDSPRHGCGYVDAFGRRGVTWSILAKRRFAKRLATLLRGGARHYWMTHNHTWLVPPVHGFADFWIPGEELTGKVGQNPWFYVDGLEEVAWRVEYSSEPSGIVHIMLPELERGAGLGAVADPAYTEGLLAMAAVNDVNVTSAWAHRETTGVYWGLRERLGLIEAEFVGHWRPDCPVRALQPQARASLYRTRRGPVLAVANRAAAAGIVDVQLDLEALGLQKDFAAQDERSGRRLERRGDRLAVPLAPRSYTFVSLR